MPRKQHSFHYIYKSVCKINGRYYIGMHSTSNLEDGYLGSGKRLKYSLNKYGRENHKIEIIEWCNDKRSLKEREKELVNESLLQDVNCMNLTIGGEGGPHFSGRKHSEEMKRKLSEKIKGKTLSKESKLKISEANRKRKLSDKTKKKLSDSAKRRILTTNIKLKISESVKKKMTEEVRLKISKAAKEREIKKRAMKNIAS